MEESFTLRWDVDKHGKALDNIRRREPDIPTRAEMIRRLIERADKAVKEKS